MKQVITNLSEKELAAYNAIKKLKQATVIQIAQEAELKRTTVYNFIERLKNASLIKNLLKNGRPVYQVADKSTDFLIADTKSKIEQNFELIIGARALKRTILRSLDHSNIDWLVDSKTTTELLGNRFFEKYIELARQKSVNLRVLRSSVSRGNHKYHSQEAIKKIGRVVRRSQSTIPYNGSVALFDNRVLLVSSNNNGMAYLLDDEIIFQTFESIFTGLWKYSKSLGEKII